jgi:SAM domain (Sterile alpha motif)
MSRLVEGWLQGIGLGYAISAFKEQDLLTPEDLSQLQLEDFEALGVVDLEDRKKLFYLTQRVRLAVDKKRASKRSLVAASDASAQPAAAASTAATNEATADAASADEQGAAQSEVSETVEAARTPSKDDASQESTMQAAVSLLKSGGSRHKRKVRQDASVTAAATTSDEANTMAASEDSSDQPLMPENVRLEFGTAEQSYGNSNVDTTAADDVDIVPMDDAVLR